MFGPLFDLSFWFTLQPSALSPAFERGFFLIFAGFVLVGAATRIASRYKKSDRFALVAYRKVASLLTIMGILGLLWYFFTYETAYFIGARFWFLIWALGVVAWAYTIVRFVRVKVPIEKEALKNRSVGNQYLPRKKGT